MSQEQALLDRLSRERSSRSAATIASRSQRSGPLSYTQRGIWLACQVERDLPVYVIPAAYRLWGDLRVDVLTRALSCLVARHAALRTIIQSTGDGPVQTIRDDLELDLECIDASTVPADGLDELLSQGVQRPFSLERGPLFRARLFRMSDQEHLLQLLTHHVISDGWSGGVLIQELDVLYRAFSRGEDSPLLALPIQHLDYVLWQRERLTGDVLDRLLGYWRHQLEGAPARLELPTDRPRPSVLSRRGAKHNFTIPVALRTALGRLARQENASLYMVLLSAFNTWLARYSSQQDFVVGTPVANRNRTELEGLVGCFVSAVALRTEFSDDPPFRELLRRVRASTLGAFAHQELPFVRLVDELRPERSLSHAPIFQVMFGVQNAPPAPKSIGSLVIEPRTHDFGVGNFDFDVRVRETPAGIHTQLRYSTDLFERSTIERMGRHYVRLLESIVADPERRLSQLAMLEAGERHQLVVERNTTQAAFPCDLCVHQLFEQQAQRRPDAVAVVAGDEAITYAALNRRANQLAHALRARGIGPDGRVATCVEPSLELVAGLLGILKAGGAYVPLDAAYPEERLRRMLGDSAPAALVTTPRAGDRLHVTDHPWPVIDPTNTGASWAAQPEDDLPRRELTSRHLVYVIYTSGSTGTPKGVMIEHRGLINLLTWLQQTHRLQNDDVVLQKTAVSFDVSAWEIFWPLSVGACVVMAPTARRQDPATLTTLMEQSQVTTIHFVPSVLQTLMEAPSTPCAALRRILCGGEALSPALARQVRSRWPDAALHHLYGPTESTVDATGSDRLIDVSDGRTPIGGPVANTQIYIVDSSGALLPNGAVGEMYVGGVGIARGYLNQPALTAERFVPDPFGPDPGARLYRTGDLGRWRPDGQIEFIGRRDFQVKVRGFRIELGEIEARLTEHPAVREAVVLAREDRPGDTRLVAYWVGAADLAARTLRSYLIERLPDYMVPAAYVRLDVLPLMPNGKADRRALPAPGIDAYRTRSYEQPIGDTEIALAEIWADLLGVPRVGRHDDFFDLGGHSLLAMRVLSHVRQALAVDVPVGVLFDQPTLNEFAKAIEMAARADLPAIERVPRDSRLPLSFAQQRLWFLEQLGGLDRAYHIRKRIRLRGALDRSALARALSGIVMRHEALRTTFQVADGTPAQRIAPPAENAFELRDHDLVDRGGESALPHVLEEEAEERFDLAVGPLIRGRLIRVAQDDHVLLLTMHHIVADAWSLGVLVRELGVLYDAFHRGAADPLPTLPVQYADYAVWQRRWIDGPILAQQAAHWREQLAGAPELLELPTDRARPARMDHSGAAVPFTLDEALTGGLKTLSRRHGTTLFMTLLAAWAAVLARLSRQDDIVIGTPTANRSRPEIEGLIGFFVNTVALRVDLSGTPTVVELLRQVKERTLQAQHHQDIPFEQVVEVVQPGRSLAHSPLFQVLFAWNNTPHDGLVLPGLRVAAMGGPRAATAKFDLSLALSERGGRIVGNLKYATALFDRETVTRYTGYFQRALEAMIADDHQPVGRLPLWSDDECRQVVTVWNETAAEYPRESCVHERCEVQAAQTPDSIAVTCDGEHLTYAELHRRANRLAHGLIERGVAPDVRVALCVERSPAMLVGLLAVLKAGGAYVPLDPTYPSERLRYMLADSGAAAVLTQRSFSGLFAASGVPTIELDMAGEPWAGYPATQPRRDHLTAEHLAYVIFTSGSTGQPKGVMNHHRCLVNRLAWVQTVWPLDADDTVLGKTSLGFDGSVRELLWPLTTGARIALARPEGQRDPAYLLATIRNEQITTLNLVPSMLQMLLEQPAMEQCGSVRRVLCGGEALSSALLRRLKERLRGVEVHNLYGPSEAATATAALHCGSAGTGAVVPIGRPISNTRIYVLDETGAPVPSGVPGELYIGGAGVARGYTGRAAMTAERFVPDPFGDVRGARLYRTGDLGRWRSDGALEFLGRTDAQVKVRGFRIELGEIETALRRQAGVRDAVVVARDRGPGDQQLVAYWTGDADVDTEALRADLRERLPEYMVPAAYVRLARLPLTATGKVDRRVLPAPDAAAYPGRRQEPAIGPTELALAAIWADVLSLAYVGRWDDFFALGGHSLLAVKVVSRVRQVFSAEIPLRDLFLYPVLADFARALRTAPAADLPLIEPGPRGDHVPLSFAQQRLWFVETMGNAGRAYHISKRLRVRGVLDREALRTALNRIVARHEALRTSFVVVDGCPEQRIAPTADHGFSLREHDLSGLANTDVALQRLVYEEAETPFDVAAGPLIRGRLIRLRTDDHVLLFTMHHIVSDGWSVSVFYRELNALYRTLQCGEPDPLPALPIQYADYARWQRRWADTNLQEQSAYWKRRLTGAPDVVALPTDAPRTTERDHAGAMVSLELDTALTAGLKTLSRRHGTTLFMTVLAGWATVLSRLSHQHDIVIGTPVANRGRREIEALIGFFVNMLALRLNLSGAPSVAELLERVKELTLEAQQHQDIPFEQVVELVQPARSLVHSPLFQVLFAWQSSREDDLALSGVDVSRVEGPLTVQFDLALSLAEVGGRIRGALLYATALFHRETVMRYAGYLRRVLEEMVADDQQRIDRLVLLPAEERTRIVEEWNATDVAFPVESSVHASFETQAARTPDAVAVVSEGEQLTYAELNRRSNLLAQALIERGVGPDARVAICTPRTSAMVIGLLGILKAGGAYVPLDPVHPVERLQFMLADSGAVALLIPLALQPLFARSGVPVLTLDAIDRERKDGAAENPRHVGVTSDRLAYVIYTSGSTGRPKGVMNPHASVRNMLAWSQDQWKLGAWDAVLQEMPFSFDVSVRELFWPLSVGARLVLAEPEGHKDVDHLVETIRREQVGVAHFAPAMLRAFLNHPRVAACATLSRVVTGGESLSPPLIEQFYEQLPHSTLFQEYGPTETTVTVTGHPATRGHAEEARRIGGPKPNTRVYVLDDVGEPVPVGAVGELHIGGAQVARGYVGAAAPTAERFVPDPFSGATGARLYRTGDFGRWRADGAIEFIGRNDDQIKVRGHRIELGEIATQLTAHAVVREALVLAREDMPGDKTLVAYWVGGTVSPEALQAHLASALPHYMIPSAYVSLESLPLLPNGKVDREALPPPGDSAYAASVYEAPVGDTETALAALWAEVLGLGRVGRNDDFFRLGGHSLLATKLLVRINTSADANLALKDIFEAPVLSRLAARVLQAQLSRFDPVQLAALLPDSSPAH